MRKRNKRVAVGIFCLIIVVMNIGSISLQVSANEYESEEIIIDSDYNRDNVGKTKDEENILPDVNKDTTSLDGENYIDENKDIAGENQDETIIEDESKNESVSSNDIGDNNVEEETGEENKEDESKIDNEVKQDTIIEDVVEDLIDGISTHNEQVSISSGKCGDNLTWVLDNGTLTISGTGRMWDYRSGAPWGLEDVIKLKLEEGITYIGDSAFWYNANISGNLTIPSSITEIGDYAFWGCTGLNGSLILPDGITRIGKCAFYECSGFTGDLIIPDSVTEIGNDAFSCCKGFNGKLKISNNITEIKDGTFNECENLNGNLIIPENISIIGDGAFAGDSNLSGELVLPAKLEKIGFLAFSDCKGFSGNLILPDGIKSIGDSAFANCIGFGGNLIIPDSVVELGECAFINCSGFSGNLVIGNGIKIIHGGTFADCSGFIGTLSIGTGVEYIEDKCNNSYGAFSGCSGFTGDLIIPDSVIEIGSSAFFGCSGFMGDLIIPDSVIEIGDDAFDRCSGFTGDLIIPNSVIEIGSSAFYGCRGFTGDLIIPDSIIEIRSSTFRYCHGFDGKLVIGCNVEKIGGYAFEDCDSLTGDLIIPDSVTEIGDSAFSRCKGFDGKLVIGNNVGKIESSAFGDCDSLTGDLIIPDSVTEMGDFAFAGCSGFDGKLVIGNNVGKIENAAFYGCDSLTGDLIIPDSVIGIGDYAFEYCSGFDGSLHIGEGIESIGNRAFSSCGFIEDLSIGGKLNELSGDMFGFDRPQFEGTLTINANIAVIGDGCFSGIPFTGMLTLPNSLTVIGRSAFEGAQFEGNLVIPESVTELRGGAFYNSGFTGTLYLNNNITVLKNDDYYSYGTFERCGFTGKIDIPEYMEDIGNAFRYCKGITELSVPSHVAKGAAFTGCTHLKRVKITDSSKGSIEKINDNMFDGCTSLEIINLPDSVKTIGQYAFRDCKKLEKLDFFNSIETIDSYAFQGCSSVRTIIFPETIQTIGDGAFRDCKELKLIQTYCGINVLPKSGAAFNSDGVKVIYADEQENWKQIVNNSAYGITNAIVISYSEYINSDGMYPSEITVPQNYFGLCAVNASTGRLIRKSTITLDGITLETDLDGVVLQKSSVESAQHLISAQAENYFPSEKKYYTTKSGNLTCIEIAPVEDTEDKTSSDISVDSNQVGICAVDSSTSKIIQGATIVIDGKEITVPQTGVLYFDADNMTHSVWAIADGYMQQPLKNEEFLGGKLITIELPKMDTYIIGRFNGWALFDILIDMQKYSVSPDIGHEDLEPLQGKMVICTVKDNMITHILDLDECLDINVSMSVYPSDMSYDVFGFIYQNGKFAKKETTFKINVQCTLKKAYSFISADLFDSLNISNIRVSVDNLRQEVKIAAEGSNDFRDSIEINVNKNLKLNESMDFLTKVKLVSDKTPEQPSVKQDLNIKVLRGDGYWKSAEKTLWIVNADLQQDQIEERKEKEDINKNNVSKNQVKNTLQNCLLFNLDGTVLDTKYFSKEQLRAVEEFLTIWIVNIDASTDTARKISYNEKFVKDVLGKLGVNISTKLGISKTTAQVKIKANTKNDGDRTFCFVLDMGNYHWDDQEPYARFGTVSWFVEEEDNIAVPYRSGKCAMLAKADTERFISQVRDLAIDSIKKVYDNTGSVKVANKVADEILDKRVLALIKDRYDNTSNMVFTLLLKASQSSIKSGNRSTTVTDCPVDLYIYDSSGNLAGAIIDDVAYPVDNGVHVYMDGSSKVAVYYADEYRIKFVGTGIGKMKHEVYEYRDTGECVRQLEFNNVPLEVNKIYYENIPDRLFANATVYELEEEDSKTIQADTDTYADKISEIRYVEGISVVPEEFNLTVGKTHTLYAKIVPEDASVNFVEWNSSDENIVTVDDEGNITAINEGIAIISVTSLDGGYNAECKITVKNNIDSGENGNGSDNDILPEDIPADGVIPDGLWAAGITDATYTGTAITQSFRLYDSTKRLKEKTDYTVSYKNNKVAYTYTDEDHTAFEQTLADTGKRTRIGTFDPAKAPQVIIKMKGNYAGTQIIYFRILSADITEEAFSADDLTVTFSGKKQTPAPVLTWNGKSLKYGTDFYIPEYDAAKSDKTAFTQSGTYDLTITGKKNFTGKIPVTLTISKSSKQIAMNKVSVKGIKSQLWTGTSIEPSGFTVSYKKDVLSETNGDYTVSFGENTAVGTGTVTLTGAGTDGDGDGYSYIGTKTISFKITGTTMNKVTVSGLAKNYTYAGEPIEPDVVLTCKANKNAEPVTLSEGIHYTVDYQRNTDKGTATIIFTGIADGGYTGTKKQTFKIISSGIEDKTEGGTTVETIKVSFKDTSNMQDGVYTAPYMKGGAAPGIIVTDGDKTLVSGKDYTVSYLNNRKPALSTDIKAPTVVVKGKGNYTGTKQIPFSISAKALTNENGIIVAAADKTVSSGKNGYRQKFKVIDADGKTLGAGDYEKGTATYTLIQTENADGTYTEKNELLDKDSIVPAGSVIQITVQGKGIYAGGSATGTYRILNNGYDISKATIQICNQPYTGGPVTITEQAQFKEGKVYVKIGKEKRVLNLGQDIEVVSDSYLRNVNKGTAKVTFRGINDFGGTKTVTYKIGVRSITDFWQGIFNRIITTS